jgi:serine/threonine protein kinase/dienelactone hydrolase
MLINDPISHYKIIKKLGRGGMGEVYFAEDTKLDRPVALKFLHPQVIGDPTAKERFIREAKAASALDHINICSIYEIDESDTGQMFLAMAYCSGQSLNDKIDLGSLSFEEALDITIQIARGLEKAHAKDIIHRDIKPANIIITDEGIVKIVDFGLAKLKGQSAITREGTILGTVAYMSPEQTMGVDIDHRADIWALGVVFYEMLTGERPFKGDYQEAVIYNILNTDPQSIREINPNVPEELEHVVYCALRKDPKSRYKSAAKMLEDLRAYQESLSSGEWVRVNFQSFVRLLIKPKVAIPLTVLILAVVLFSTWYSNRQSKILWAKEVALPEIKRLVDSDWRDYTEAYKIAEEAEKYIPDDPRLAELMSSCALNINIKTEPPGADVYVKEYDTPDSAWKHIGISPLKNIRMPIGFFRWKLEKEGYETVSAASSSWDYTLNEKYIPFDLVRVLDKKGTIPEGMVRVQGCELDFGKFDDFFIDQFEVTNRQYKRFINAGGYRNKEYWKHKFVRNGTILTWDQAMEFFVDRTGRPGPSLWQAGDYQEGEDDYPVSGISWYEAAAYAEFVKKSLPTELHWGLARGEETPMVRWFQMGGAAIFIPFSNFNSKGPNRVGSNQSVSPFGAFDMAGNVREWCWNKTPHGRLVRGGAWDDAAYQFANWSQIPAFDRTDRNGFRCVIYPDPDKIPTSVFDFIEWEEPFDFYKEEPVSDTIFKVYKEKFDYDPLDLSARVEKDDSHDDWIKEHVSFDAAYGDERMIAVLFLPKYTNPPYQTVIYFPGEQAIWRNSSNEIVDSMEFKVFLSFIVKSGRAVLYPVYKGTMERESKQPEPGFETHRQAERRVQIVKDFRRCIDYLETRAEIDIQRLAYYGLSWGGDWPAAIIPAVENRLKASVILAGGLDYTGRPEVNPINYISRVKLPTLMINGKYDMVFDSQIKPMYDLLGTPQKDKDLNLYESDHIPPQDKFIRDTLNWLDQYLGPVI